MSDAVVIAENVSKEFVLQQNAQDSLKKRVIGLVHKRWRPRPHVFSALDDVSLTVRRGEALGLMGHNGSGKSTLLSLIAGIYPATAGTIRVWGRMVPMIALGVGFHPELTGAENVYLNASLFGLKNAQTKRLFPDICDFAELGEFVSEPVKNYSSGMQARLGFAVSVHIEPEILLADEILSVGDEAFQEKCINRIAKMRESGLTLILVSHSRHQIARFCDHFVRLEHGRVVERGVTSELGEYEAGQDEAV